MLSATELPRGIDPYAFDRKLSAIAAKHGIIYLDVFDDFKRAPHPETLFYPADGHLGPGGDLSWVVRLLACSGKRAFRSNQVVAIRNPRGRSAGPSPCSRRRL